MRLSDEFITRFCSLTGKTATEVVDLFEGQPYKGIRINTLKSDYVTVQNGLPNRLEQTPFCKDGYYIPSTTKSIGNHPLHHAGAFYVQEPSATSAVTVLDPKPGDRVLDLCAAPGGKSSQIAAALCGTGLVWSNEAIKSRAGALLSNTERLGIKNAIISSAFPDILSIGLVGFFDKILVDAPCSGEGMIRHNPAITEEWSVQNIEMCAERQKKILSSASAALRVGGRLCYSTCTFALEENEQVVEAFLKQHNNFRLIDANVEFGSAGIGEYAEQFNPSLVRRVFPFHGGEGHFVALFEKTDGDEGIVQPFSAPYDKAAVKLFLEFWKETFEGQLEGTFCSVGDNLYLVPETAPNMKTGIVRAGLLLGQSSKNRFIPSHALFSAANISPKQVIDFALEDDKLSRYLFGLELPFDGYENGYIGVRVCGIPLGFGKMSGGTLKNHYPKGLRRLTY